MNGPSITPVTIRPTEVRGVADDLGAGIYREKRVVERRRVAAKPAPGPFAPARARGAGFAAIVPAKGRLPSLKITPFPGRLSDLKLEKSSLVVGSADALCPLSPSVVSVPSVVQSSGRTRRHCQPRCSVRFSIAVRSPGRQT